MAQQVKEVKVCVTKAGNLSLISWTHIKEGKN